MLGISDVRSLQCCGDTAFQGCDGTVERSDRRSNLHSLALAKVDFLLPSGLFSGVTFGQSVAYASGMVAPARDRLKTILVGHVLAPLWHTPVRNRVGSQPLARSLPAKNKKTAQRRSLSHSLFSLLQRDRPGKRSVCPVRNKRSSSSGKA